MDIGKELLGFMIFMICATMIITLLPPLNSLLAMSVSFGSVSFSVKSIIMSLHLFSAILFALLFLKYHNPILLLIAGIMPISYLYLIN